MTPSHPTPTTGASSGRPVAITAHLAYSKELQASLLQADTRAQKKEAMREAYSITMLSLTEYLTHLRDERQVLDFASSWLLAEVVVHARAEHADTVMESLRQRPELKDVKRASLGGLRHF